MKKRLTVVAIFILAVFGCVSVNAKEVSITITSIVLVPDSLTLSVGEQAEITIMAYDSSGNFHTGSLKPSFGGIILYEILPSCRSSVSTVATVTCDKATEWVVAVSASAEGDSTLTIGLGTSPTITAEAKVVVIAAAEKELRFDPVTESLHFQVLQGNIDAVKKLLADGSDVNKIAKGHSPLHVSAFANHAAMVNLLLDAGADWSLLDARGFTAAGVAQSKGNSDVLTILAKWDCKGGQKYFLIRSGYPALGAKRSQTCP